MTMKEEFFCTLCLDVTSENSANDYLTITECGHIFHKECVVPAYNNGYTQCPVCRLQLRIDKLRKIFGIQVKRNPMKRRAPPPPIPSTSSAVVGYDGASTAGTSTDVVDNNNEVSFSSTTVELEAEEQPVLQPEPTEYDHKFKVIIVGDAGVGKSSLMQRYADGTYTSKLFSTVGCDWRSKTVVLGEKVIRLSIWDTVGQERHRSLITNYVRDAHGALICYDITNASSFQDIEYWYDFVRLHSMNDCVKILVGNKTDMEEQREVDKSDAKKFAQRIGASFFETSAKDAYNVEVTFRTLAAQILETDSIINEIESRKQSPYISLGKHRDLYSTNNNSLSTACSVGWHWTKSGASGAARGVRRGWNNFKN